MVVRRSASSGGERPTAARNPRVQGRGAAVAASRERAYGVRRFDGVRGRIPARSTAWARVDDRRRDTVRRGVEIGQKRGQRDDDLPRRIEVRGELGERPTARPWELFLRLGRGVRRLLGGRQDAWDGHLQECERVALRGLVQARRAQGPRQDVLQRRPDLRRGVGGWPAKRLRNIHAGRRHRVRGVLQTGPEARGGYPPPGRAGHEPGLGERQAGSGRPRLRVGRCHVEAAKHVVGLRKEEFRRRLAVAYRSLAGVVVSSSREARFPVAGGWETEEMRKVGGRPTSFGRVGVWFDLKETGFDRRGARMYGRGAKRTWT
ncbi:unnamed protein product [Scytosiphon promiscuus]